MNFLPQDYKSPKVGGHYMKFQDGENKFRIMSAPILGWEDWIDKKPIRYILDEKPAKPHDPTKPLKHFWAFIVFNYVTEQIEILHITQASIRNSIESLCNDVDWGSPFTYDIKVTKKGQGKDTEYSVNPAPHKPLEPYIRDCFNERKCNLNALFDNADPFAVGWPTYTQLGVCSDITHITAPKNNIISDEDLKEIQIMFANCPSDYQENLLKSMAKMSPPINSLLEIPEGIFPKFKRAIFDKYSEEQKKNSEYFDLIAS